MASLKKQLRILRADVQRFSPGEKTSSTSLAFPLDVLTGTFSQFLYVIGICANR
jgi:hypothetical protein